MSMWRFAVCLALVPFVPLHAQGDLSRKPYVIERLHRATRFELDGTGRTTLDMRVRIQSTAAVNRFGQLTIAYSSGNQNLDIDVVRVLKAGGDTVTAPASAVQDLTGPVARDAPMYSDLREKVVTVPALQPGDTLEYHVTWTTHTPFAPGNFWDESDFTRASIVLDERTTYDVPRQAHVQVKTEGGPQPRVTDNGDRRTYVWQRANLTIDTTGRKATFLSRGEHHGVELTTFRSWAEVGQWYQGLERDRETVTPEIRQRAAQLVRGRTTLRDSIAALYDFVSQRVRYVSLQFGLGRYQPHPAADVLANQYGDCKDKHVLLAALLRAIGVPSAPVLIPALEPLDAELPSPAQFNHLITFVPTRDSLWLDATPGVAPFQFLFVTLRGKQALVIPQDAAPRLARVPVAAPYPTFNRLDATGTLTDAGRLTTSIRYESRGDVEVIMRGMFQQVPEESWHLFAERLAASENLDGTVQSTTAGDPLATSTPFAFSFQLDNPDAVTWSNQHAELDVPLPPLDLPASDSLPTDSLLISVVDELPYHARIVLPKTVTSRLPAAVTLTRDYATYHSSAERLGDTLLVQRTVTFIRRVLPPDRAAEFRSFRDIVREDEKRTISLTRSGDAPVTPAATGGDADELHRRGMAALDANDARSAVRAFRAVTELVPRHQWAWNNLGRAYMMLGKTDSALLAYRRQIDINPYDQYSYNNMGLTLRRVGRRDEALAAFQKQIEVNPLDKYAHANLGRLLVDMHRDSAAADALEHAVSIAPDDTTLQELLGSAYARLGRGSDALAAFRRAVALSPTPEMWNNVAYSLAEQRLELDSAEMYARRAIDQTEGILRGLALEDAGPREMFAVGRLGAFWDTMGWIYFARGDLGRAELYVRAAWLLSNESAIGEHLGQIQQRLGRSADAIQSYALAMNAGGPRSETIRPRLIKLVGSEREADRRIDQASSALMAMRTIKLGNVLAADVSGEVQLLIGAGPRVEAVRIASGPSQLQQLTGAIRRATVTMTFPPDPDNSVKLVRRGVVSCSSPSGNCALVLMPVVSIRFEAGTIPGVIERVRN